MLRDVDIIARQADERCTCIGSKRRTRWLLATIAVCSRLWAGGVLGRRSPCHTRGADQLGGHVERLRCSYTFIRPHRALQFGRETRTPAMQAGVVRAPMNWSDLFTAPAPL